MNEEMHIFNRQTVRRHRERAARGLSEHDFLFCEVGERLADRLLDVKRSFATALDLGCHSGQLGRLLAGRGDVQTLVQCDLAPAMVRQAAAHTDTANAPALLHVTGDEEALPFAPHCFDLVMSNLSLHWVNDLPGALVQIRQSLKPDGLFLATMFGGETLRELRHVLTQTEIELEGGLSPRLSPFADVRDAGALLQRAGLALCVADSEAITVSYSDPFKLLRDLRGMGETNAVNARRKSFSRRETLMRAMKRYQDEFADENGRIPATFQIVYLTGWAPDASQPQPLKPGSAQVSLADVLGAAPDES